MAPYPYWKCQRRTTVGSNIATIVKFGTERFIGIHDRKTIRFFIETKILAQHTIFLLQNEFPKIQ